MILKKILPYTFIFVIVALFLYSFTQVDLGLTLTRASIFQEVQRGFQQIGYFQRDISTSLFLIIISALFLYYIYFIFLALEKKLKIKTLRNLILIT